MYIWIDERLGLEELPSAKLGVKPYKRPFNSGGEYIREQDGKKLLTILAGPSPYQSYIRRIMAVQGPVLPRKFFRIVSLPQQVPDERVRRRLFHSINNKIVGGTIDRRTGTIYMRDSHLVEGGVRPTFMTRLEWALHEAVHLFAHPYIAQVEQGTFQAKYGKGFGEGATQVITEDIMAAQGISKHFGKRPYDEFTPPIRKLIKIFSPDKNRFARAYFRGEIREFTEAMESRWGAGWKNVARFTSEREKQKALDEIDKLETAYRRRPWRRRPAGDFPIPPPSMIFA
jgi:hypothetical protein